VVTFSYEDKTLNSRKPERRNYTLNKREHKKKEDPKSKCMRVVTGWLGLEPLQQVAI
jgi:hypothetical protein